jgi:protein O-mannosyl-transferase
MTLMNRRIQPWLALIFIFTAILLYARVIPNYFLCDDYFLICKLLTEKFYVSWELDQGGFFRPLTVLSYWLDLKLYGFTPWGYHITSILIHGLSAWLVYLWGSACLRFFQISEERSRELGLWAGILFLVLPTRTEAVSYIAGRNDLLAAGFSLLALWAGLKYLERERPAALVGSLAALAGALLSKESALATAPILAGFGALAVWGGWHPPQMRTAGRRIMLGTAAILAAYLLLRRCVLGAWVGGYGAGVHLGLFSFASLRSFMLFCLRSLLPALPVSWQPVLSAWRIEYLVAGALFLFICGLWPLRRLPLPARAHLWLGLVLAGSFVITLLPVLGLSIHLFRPEGDRLLYLPSVFFSLGLAVAIYLAYRARKAWREVLVGLTLVSALLLQVASERWVIASHLAQKVLAETSRLCTQSRVIVLNVPDNYRGAYIFRVGFMEAMLLFQKQIILARMQIAQRDPKVKRMYKLYLQGEHILNGQAPGQSLAESERATLAEIQAEQDHLEQYKNAAPFLADVKEFHALQAVKEIEFLTTTDVNDLDDSVLLTLTPVYLDLQLQATNVKIEKVQPLPDFPVERISARRVRFPRASLSASGTDVLYYSQDTMHRLDLSGAGALPGEPASH